jgi:hypothetical protein
VAAIGVTRAEIKFAGAIAVVTADQPVPMAANFLFCNQSNEQQQFSSDPGSDLFQRHSSLNHQVSFEVAPIIVDG